MSENCADESMLGNDVTFKRGDGASPEQFVLVGTVTDLGGPNKKKDTKENTKRGQSWKTYFGTLRDAGEVKLKIKSKPGHTDFDRLEADFDDDDCPRNYQIVFEPISKTLQVAAIATAFEPEYPQDDQVMASVTLKVSGKPVWL